MFLNFWKGSDDGLLNSFIQSFSFFIQRTEEENPKGEEEPLALTGSLFIVGCFFFKRSEEEPSKVRRNPLRSQSLLLGLAAVKKTAPSSHGAMVQKFLMNAHSRLRRHVGQWSRSS